jgi:hypothetical protein
LLSSATAYDEYEPEDDEDVVYLDHPERLRLLLGLASQWEEESSPRVECEASQPHSHADCAARSFTPLLHTAPSHRNPPAQRRASRHSSPSRP